MLKKVGKWVGVGVGWIYGLLSAEKTTKDSTTAHKLVAIMLGLEYHVGVSMTIGNSLIRPTQNIERVHLIWKRVSSRKRGDQKVLAGMRKIFPS